MVVEVRLFATFREGREKKIFMELSSTSTVKNIIDILLINENDIGILLINGRDGDINAPLEEGFTVSLFPPVGGG